MIEYNHFAIKNENTIGENKSTEMKPHATALNLSVCRVIFGNRCARCQSGTVVNPLAKRNLKIFSASFSVNLSANLSAIFH
jgi:hypothetical protein